MLIRLDAGFELNGASVENLWQAVIAANRERGTQRILAVGEIHRSMSVSEIFRSAARPLTAHLFGLKLALCWKNFVPDADSRLFQDSARNRGLEVRYFENEPAALAWLASGEPAKPA